MVWLIVGAFFSFIFWRIKRAKQNHLERIATGEARSPLFWIGTGLAISVFALAMYIASLKSAEINPTLWFLFIALFVATLLIRRKLRWRYPH